MTDYPPTAATQIEEVYDTCADLADGVGPLSGPGPTEAAPPLIALQQVYATLAVAQAIVELTAALKGAA